MAFSQRLGWIGVDVGTHTVKLAQVARDGASVRLHRAAVIQRPIAWRGDDVLGQEQPIASHSEIRAALECGNFEGRNAICSLPMNVCKMRSLNVPPGSDHERRTIIGDELAEEWAENKQSMEFDFWEIDTGRVEKTSDSFNVNVIAATRLWVSQLWRDCRKTGLDCWALDGVPLAMARAVSLCQTSRSSQRTMAVDWGYSNTTLCVVGDERPLFSRRIQDCAFGRVLSGIMNEFNVTLDEAQHLAETQGLPGPEENPCADLSIQTAIADAATEPLDELVRQIGRTLQFIDMQRRHIQPASICLMGGGAFLGNIGPYLSQALSLAVQIWQMTPATDPIACAAGNRAAVFSGAGGTLGLSLEGRMKNMINLVPVAYRRQQIVRKRATQWGSVVCVVLAVGLAWHWLEMRMSAELTQQLEVLTREQAPTQTMLGQLVDMRKQLEELQQQEIVAQELETQRNALALLGVVSQSAQKTEGHLRLTKLEINNFQGPTTPAPTDGSTSKNGVVISGESLDNKAVAKLLDGLQYSGLFSRVNFTVNERPDTTVSLRDYEVRCDF